ncbi:hypothetical protein BGZ65_008555 [Modicella reniformis]|uniref:Uncharacterized protein n=1 Tax=Modicella reniformis TaxID=1440133 RepID=A0A9P6SSG7_9FUNG|nr:hypothetical protein BGZ65_008555 [Modicella reniformis]
MSRVTPFGEPFKTGDVIGLFISLPPDGNEKTFFKHRRLRRPFYFKGQLYFESVDYSPTKRYIEMAEYEATPNAKEKEQLRFDDGTLGYYPVISVYRNGTATANFGPDFKYPPNKDPEAEAENKPATAEQRVWRPMCERWEEKLIEECLIDLVDEVELWVSEQANQERGLQSSAAKSAADDASMATDQATPQGYDHRREDYDDSEMSSGGRQDRSHASGRRRGSEGVDDEDVDVDVDIDMDSGIERDQTGDDGDGRGGHDDDDSEDGHRHRRGHGGREGRDETEYSGEDDRSRDVEMSGRDYDDHYSEHDHGHSRRGEHEHDQRYRTHEEDSVEDEDDGSEDGSEVAYYDRP